MSRHFSGIWAPPPPPALGPEPSYHTQLLLSEMFSQQAILRNYDSDTIQAVMMALDEERQVSEKQLLFNEEASLALARIMLQDQHDENQRHCIHRAQTNLNAPLPQSPVCPGPARCMPAPAMKRDNSSSESSGYTTSSSGRIGESTLTQPSAERPRRACATTCASDRFMLTMEEMEEHAIEAINPLPTMPAQRLNCTRSTTSSSTGSHESEEKAKGITNHAGRIRKLAPAAPLSKLLDTDVATKEMTAALPATLKSDASATNATPSETTGKRRKRKNRECLICQRTTAECKMHMRKLTCGHHFCSSCIDRWLATKDTCPYCRQCVTVAPPKTKRQSSFSAVSA